MKQRTLEVFELDAIGDPATQFLCYIFWWVNFFLQLLFALMFFSQFFCLMLA